MGTSISRRGVLALAVLLPGIGAPALAHHSFAVFFDDSRTVRVTGVVQEFQFRNPHGLIRLEVKGEDGSQQVWKAETNSPSILERRGWKRDTIKPGEVITVEGWPARDGTNYLRMRSALRADGKPVGSVPAAETAGDQK